MKHETSRRTLRPRRTGMAAFLLLAVAGAGAAEYDRADALQVSQAAIGRSVAEASFRDVDGGMVSLADLRGRPLVVNLVYTSCHHVCPLITRNLARTVGVAYDALGEDAFSVVTIGFDWQNDTPDRMRQYALQLGIDRPHWYFLAGDGGSIRRVTESLGFQYYPSAKGFDHLSQVSVVAGDGIVYRQVYGVDVDTQALVEPLKELVFDTRRQAGFLEHWLDTFRLFCTVYDANSDRYRFDYSILMTLFVGILCLGGIAVFIVREWRLAR